MKLHLPVKLRASLIAAVIAVSASVYNAYGAHTYKSEFGSNQFEFSSSTTGVNGNDYIVETFNSYSWTDSASVTHEIAKNEAGTWCKVVRDTSGAFVQLGDAITETVDESTLTVAATSEGSIIFNITDDADTANFEGNTTLQADNISFNNNLVTVDGGANGRTDINTETLTIGQSGTDPVTEVKTSVALENVDIEASSTILGAKDRLTINNSSTAAADTAVSLGAVSGTGSLTVKGSSKDDQWVAMDSVDLDNKGSLELGTIGATVGGDVHVNDLILTDSQTIVNGGDVTIAGKVVVTDESSLTASGDILSNPLGDGTGSANIAGTVTSTGGDIFLDNGTITGSVIASADQTTSPDKGDITLKNIAVSDSATINASGDLTLTGNSTITDNKTSDNGTPDDTSDDFDKISVGGDLTVDDSDISGTDMTVGGAVNVQNGGTIDGSTITGATGDITIEGGSDVTNSLINGGRHLTIDSSMDDVTLAGTKIINLTGDIKIDGTTRTGLELSTQGTSTDNGYDAIPGGSILISDSTLSNATIKSGVVATVAEDGSVTYTDSTSTSPAPSGAISVATSNLSDVTLSTKSGAVGITSSTITNSEVSTKSGNVTIGGARVPVMTDSAKSIGTYSGSNNQANTSKIRFTAGLGYLGASEKISCIKVEEWNGGTVATGVTATLKKNGVTIATSEPVDLTGTDNNMVAFEFANPVTIDPDATDYVLEFSADVRIRLYDAHSAIVQYGDNTQNWSAKVIVGHFDDYNKDSYTSQLIGATVITENGTLSMTNTYTAASTGEGAKDTVLEALGSTNKSTISASYLDGGTNVKVAGELQIGRSRVEGDVHLESTTNSVYFEHGAESVVNIDGGEAHDASIKAGTNLALWSDSALKDDTINIANADVQVGNITNLHGTIVANLTNVYASKNTDGTTVASKLGKVNASNNGVRGTLNITGSNIEMEYMQADNTNNWPITGNDNIVKYFGIVNVDGASTVKVNNLAHIENLDINDADSSMTVTKNAYMKDVDIVGGSVVVGGASKIESVDLTNGATFGFKGEGTSTLANIANDEGALHVVDGTLETPVLNSETLVLGLSGGTVELKDVAAHGNALAASTAAVSEHVVLAGVTNAGVDNLNPGKSTIKTAGLNRLESYASTNAGTNVTLNGTRYLYTVAENFTATAADNLWMKNTAGEWELITADTALTAGAEVSKIDYSTVGGETQYDGTPGVLIGIVDADPTLSAALIGKVIPNTVTDPNAEVVEIPGIGDGKPIYQLVEKETIEVTAGFAHNPGAAPAVDEGIASLTVKGDFGANQTEINAYRLAEPVSYWKDGQEYSVDQYKAMLAAGIAQQDDFKPEYEAEATVYYTISNTKFSGMTSDGSYTSSDKAIYTQLKPVYTGTVYYSAKEKLSADDWNKFTYNENGTYTRTITTQADFDALTDKTNWEGAAANTYTYTNTVDQTGYDALTDKTGYVDNGDGTYTYTNTVDQTGYDALADKTGYVGATNNTFTHTLGYAEWNGLADNSLYVYNEDGTYTIKETITNADYRALDSDERAEYVKIGDKYIRSLTVEAAGLLDAADIKGALTENERWYTTTITGTNAGDWFEVTIGSDRDGEGYTNTFVNADGLHYKSDDTGYIQIDGTLTGSNNQFNADDTIVIDSITGANNTLTAGTTIDVDSITGTGNILNANGETVEGDDATITVGDLNSGNKLTAANGDIKTGAITGADNTLTAGTTINTGAISGADNTLTAGTTIETGAISGSAQMTAGESITTDAISGANNTLIAGTTIETGAISGSAQMTAGESITTGKISGDDSTLTAGTTVTVNGGIVGTEADGADGNTITAGNGDVIIGQTGNISVIGSNNRITATGGDVKVTDDVKGSGNIITATAVKDADGNIISGGNYTTVSGNNWSTLNGSDNQILADASIKVEAITGSTNTLTAGTSITSGAINGSTNVLTAGTIIETEAITGGSNELTAVTKVRTKAITGNGNTLEATDGNVYVWGKLEGDNNQLLAVRDAAADGGNAISVWSGISGNNNILRTEADDIASTGGALTGDNNSLTAVTGAVKNGAINGNSNELTAGTYVNTGAINGNSNELTAGTYVNTGAITGSTNELTAGTYVNVGGKLEGSGNTLTSHGVSGTEYGIRIASGLEGNDNTLVSDDGRTILGGGTSLNGNGNTVLSKGANAAGVAICLDGKLQGNNNTLTAETGAIETGEIDNADDATGYQVTGENKGNTLSAATTLRTGAINGDSNTLTADGATVDGDGATLTTGNITGDYNHLTAANGDIKTGAINGTDNVLSAKEVWVNGTLQGTSNEVTGETIDITTLSGTGQEIVSTGVDNATDTAIHIGTMSATDTTVKVALGSNGSIVIDTMNAKAAEGENTNVIRATEGNVTIGTLDNATATTWIEVGSMYGITVGSADGTVADTASNQTWKAGKQLTINSAHGLQLTDSSVTADAITGTSLTLGSGASAVTTGAVTLTGTLSLTGDGKLTANGGVTTGTLSLDGNDVQLVTNGLTVTEQLTLSNGATLGNMNIKTDGSATLVVENSQLTAGMLEGFTGVTMTGSSGQLLAGGLTGLTGDVTVQDLTLPDGTVKKSDLTVSVIETTGKVVADNSSIDVVGDITASSMEIKDGGSIEAEDVKLTGALDAEGGTLEADSVTGATSAKLTNATIRGELAMSGPAGDVNATGGSIGSITGANDVTTNGTNVGAIGMTGELNATNGTIASVTGAAGAELTGTTITGALSMDANAANADVTATGGSVIGSIANADNVTLKTATKVGGNVGMNGELIMSGELTAIAGDVTGATSADLDGSTIKGALNMTGKLDATNGTIGSVTGATGADLDGTTITGALSMDANAANADVTATGGSVIGSIANADNVTLKTASQVKGDVGMNGKLTMSGELTAIAGSVTGATSAELTGSTIKGALNVTTGTVEADGGSIGSITGTATKVDLDGTTVGDITMSTGGNLIVKDTTTGDVNDGAGNNTVANATLTNANIGSGLNVTNNMTTTGYVTVGGDVTVGNDLSVNTGALTAGNVTVHGTTTLTGGTVDVAGTFHSTTVKLVDIDGEMDKLEADKGLSLSGAAVNITSTDAKAVKVDDGGMSLTGDASVTNAGGASITGDLTVDDSFFRNKGDVAVTGKTKVSNWGVVTGDSLTTDGLEVDDNGEVTIEGTMDLNNGGLTVTDGSYVKAKGGSISEAGAVTVSGASTVTADTVTGATTVGVTNGGTLAGSVTASDAVTVTNGTITGAVTTTDGGTVTVTGADGSIVGAVNADGAVKVNGGSTGAVTVSGDAVTAENGGTINGNVANASTVKVSGENTSIQGSVTGATGLVEVTDGDITGSVTTEGGVTVSGAEASIGGSVKADAAVAVTGGTVEGEVRVSNDAVTVTDGGAIKAGVVDASDVTVTDARIDGGVANASGTVKVTNGTIADGVSTTGAAVLDDATIEGNLAAADTTVTDTVKVGSADVAGLTVNKAATLTADAAVTADGALDIKGDVVAKTGNISLTGTGDDSAITAAKVTAHDGDVVLAGTVAATDAVLSGTNVTINGTLNAGKGVSFAGQVGGTGTINKTGGDTLVMADGASIGTLNVVGSTLDIAGEGTMGRLTVNGGTIDGRSTVLADVKLGQRMTSDTIVANGRVTVGEGAVLELNDMGTIEANVADQHRETIIDGNVSGSFEVKHGYETLNVHTEGGDLVFSKNYKGAQNKTENQSATADALAAILDDATGELANVKDALANTRSEADALAALDSLSGAGLAAAPKLIADETKEHLQTLRNTIQSVSAGLMRRYDENGVRHAEIESTGVTAAVTGGSATVDADGNAEEYTRDSIGAMFTVAHAINDEWTFGAALSFSQADADCGNTTIESQGVFLDVGVMQKRGRFSQMGSIGCAFFSMDTERNVSVNAPGHGFGGTAEGSMDAMAFTMTYETSYAIWQTESYSLSSVVMAEMLFAQVDNMEEDGLGNASLRSSFDDVAAFTFGVGARYTYHFGEVSNPGYFSAEAMFVADTGDSTTKVNNAFIGGGNSFELSGPDAGNYGLRLNAGVLLPIGDQWGIFGNVTSEIRSEQTTVGGSVGVKCTF
ncbi:MAG: hypothetical protein IKA50_04820 [Clostridia bacterium]|nr:hypothetical protein [Clostridia bacterium]